MKYYADQLLGRLQKFLGTDNTGCLKKMQPNFKCFPFLYFFMKHSQILTRCRSNYFTRCVNFFLNQINSFWVIRISLQSPKIVPVIHMAMRNWVKSAVSDHRNPLVRHPLSPTNGIRWCGIRCLRTMAFAGAAPALSDQRHPLMRHPMSPTSGIRWCGGASIKWICWRSFI